MKKILLITTGGTIASKPSEEGGLTPALTSRELLEFIPELEDICHVSTIELFNLDSTNMGPSQWIKITETIKNNYNDYDGFVITHGTDTLSYTAAALSYMIQNSFKPVVLTGSQKSIYLRDTDARRNLMDAFLYASHTGAEGVTIVFDSQVILGTRARKTRTHSYNAFDSIDYPAIGRIFKGRVIDYISPGCACDNTEKKPVFSLDINSEIFVVKLIPGINPNTLKALSGLYKVLIIEAFGTGGLPNQEKFDLNPIIEDFTDKGGLVVITTQVPYEGSSLETYQVGSLLCGNKNIIEGGNMTLESITCKLMWILGKTSDREEIKALFKKPVSKDIF